jgi:hypothetical protein
MKQGTNGGKAQQQIGALRELDALIAEHVTCESPETYWEDSHGFFHFGTEQEARDAIQDRYLQNFLPDVDWTATLIQKVEMHRPYSTELHAAWQVVEKLAANPLHMSREQGRWSASFGSRQVAVSRSAPVAICLAALRSKGIEVFVDPDRIQ